MTTTDPTPETTELISDPALRDTALSDADSWREALRSRRTELARPETVTATQGAPVPLAASRRRFILGSFWTGLGVAITGGLGLLTDYLYPRNAKGFGGPIAAGKVQNLQPGGDPVVFGSGQVYLANLDPSEVRAGGSGGGRGVLALWWKCPHLGCTVPWRSTFDFGGDSDGWYRCPCHGSTYTKAGVRVFGPAPRSMDTMAIEIDGDGNITVQTGQISAGGPDNPERAISHPLLP